MDLSDLLNKELDEVLKKNVEKKAEITGPVKSVEDIVRKEVAKIEAEKKLETTSPEPEIKTTKPVEKPQKKKKSVKKPAEIPSVKEQSKKISDEELIKAIDGLSDKEFEELFDDLSEEESAELEKRLELLGILKEEEEPDEEEALEEPAEPGLGFLAKFLLIGGVAVLVLSRVDRFQDLADKLGALLEDLGSKFLSGPKSSGGPVNPVGSNSKKFAPWKPPTGE